MRRIAMVCLQCGVPNTGDSRTLFCRACCVLRAKHPEMRVAIARPPRVPLAPKKEAHYQVSRAVRLGLLPPVTSCTCVDCGVQAAHYDHRDYGQPLVVEPVCRKCNVRRGPAIGSPAKRRSVTVICAVARALVNARPSVQPQPAEA